MTAEGATLAPGWICVFDDIMAFCRSQSEHANAVSQSRQADLVVAAIGDRREIPPCADFGRNEGLQIGASDNMESAEGTHD